MTLPAPRVIIIDDNDEHLQVLANSLYASGVACLPVHFTGDVDGIPRCPHTRVLFADLHLTDGAAGTGNAQHFGTIGGLLEGTLMPTGPYAIILWTRYPDQANALRDHLEKRLVGVSKPFAVVPLDKADHLNPDGTLRSAQALRDAIHGLLGAQPQLAALFNWEERVLGASAATVSAVIDLATAGVAPDARAAAIGRHLFFFGLEAVGAGNVEVDRFRAVNEVLLPILVDRAAFLRADDDERIWRDALAGQSTDAGMSVDEAAKLNKLVHIAPSARTSPSVRGAVSLLPQSRLDGFQTFFGMPQDTAAKQQFGCNGFKTNDQRFGWMLLQVQAVCDYAQLKPGPLPFVLGLEMPFASVMKDSLSVAIAPTPPFDLGAGPRVFHVNARFQLSLSRADTAALTVKYRLRESLIGSITHGLHGYGARPGIVSFRPWKAKVNPPA